MADDTAQTTQVALDASAAQSRLTVTILFDEPFWVAVVEIEEDGTLGVGRHIFGAEPTPPEVAEFARRDFARLLRFAAASPMPLDECPPTVGVPRSPKRALREAARANAERGISTRAQEALRLQLEAQKQQRRVRSRVEREAFAGRKRAIAREKAKANHRGH
jgi:hypothetical protein